MEADMPLVTDAPEPARRHALIIGTATYAPGWDDIAEGVRAEMALAKRLLLEVLGYQQKTFDEILDPDQSDLLRGSRALARRHQDRPRTTGCSSTTPATASSAPGC